MNTTATLQVTDEQRRSFADNGYFITTPLFDSATLDAVQSEFQRMWDEDIAKAECAGNPVDIEFVRLRPFSLIWKDAARSALPFVVIPCWSPWPGRCSAPNSI